MCDLGTPATLRAWARAGLLALLLATPAAASAGEPIVLRFSHVVSVDTPKGRAAELFKRRAEELTKGAVRVDIYPEGQLYRDRDEMEALQLGKVEMLAPSLSKLGTAGVREFEVFDLPFLFADEGALRKVTEGPIGRRLLHRLEDLGLYGLAYWDNGFKVFSANRPLHGPQDFRGLRMRVQPSLVLDAQMRALETRPLVLGFSDVVRALEVGIVDGAENPVSNLYTQRMHAVQRHVTLSYHGYLGYAVLVNKRFWDGLPRALRADLERALEEATRHANQNARVENAEDLEKVRLAGTTEVYVPTREERLALKRALLPVHRQMRARIGAALLEEIYRTTGFDPDGL